MPHTSHHRKPSRKKRTQLADENGWTRVSSHHETIVSCLSQTKEALDPAQLKSRCREEHSALFTPLPVADGITEEKLTDKYHLIEQKWLASESCKQLAQAVKEALEALHIKIEVCICFGTGSMSGVMDGWLMRHDVTLYQVAAFKSVVDTIEEIQSTRPSAYAQEPNYNMLDTTLLTKLNIMRVDSPNGFELMRPRYEVRADSDSQRAHFRPTSFAYCPGAEQSVLASVLRNNPALHLSGALDWYRDIQAEQLPRSSEDETYAAEGLGPRGQELRANVQMTDTFIAEHNAHKLPDLDAADYPFHEQMLYWRKPDVAAKQVDDEDTSTERTAESK